MLTEAMLKAIEAEGDCVLVVTLQSGGGLRQTCFRHGKLRFSRLAAAPRSRRGRSSRRTSWPKSSGHAGIVGTLPTATRDDRLDVHVTEPRRATRRLAARASRRLRQRVPSRVEPRGSCRGCPKVRNTPVGRRAERGSAVRASRRAAPAGKSLRDRRGRRGDLRRCVSRSLLKTASAGLVTRWMPSWAPSRLLEGVVADRTTRSRSRCRR